MSIDDDGFEIIASQDNLNNTSVTPFVATNKIPITMHALTPESSPLDVSNTITSPINSIDKALCAIVRDHFANLSVYKFSTKQRGDILKILLGDNYVLKPETIKDLIYQNSTNHELHGLCVRFLIIEFATEVVHRAHTKVFTVTRGPMSFTQVYYACDIYALLSLYKIRWDVRFDLSHVSDKRTELCTLRAYYQSIIDSDWVSAWVYAASVIDAKYDYYYGEYRLLLTDQRRTQLQELRNKLESVTNEIFCCDELMKIFQ